MYNVNIIMSVYNGEKYLKDQIDSILNSTVTNWKLYIFDDGSSDSSPEIAQEYALSYKGKIFAMKNRENMGSTASFLYNLNRVAKHNRENEKIRVVNGFRQKIRKPLGQKLQGLKVIGKSAVNFVKKPLAFRNRETSPKCTEYYMFCDQDDFWLMDKIFLTISRLKKLERYRGKHKPCMIFTDAILVDEDLKFVEKSFYKTNHMKAGKCDLAHILMENKAVGCTVALNQAAADVLSYSYPASENRFKFRNEYDYIRYHDWWMALICSSIGFVKFYNVPTVMYRQHSDNQVGQGSFMNYVKNRASDKDDIRRRIDDTIRQAESFYRCYGSMLKKRKLKVLKHFIKLREYHPIVKRLIMFRYGFFKSGFIRNIALLLSV